MLISLCSSRWAKKNLLNLFKTNYIKHSLMCFKVGKSAEIVAWLVRVWASADTTLSGKQHSTIQHVNTTGSAVKAAAKQWTSLSRFDGKCTLPLEPFPGRRHGRKPSQPGSRSEVQGVRYTSVFPLQTCNCCCCCCCCYSLRSQGRGQSQCKFS